MLKPTRLRVLSILCSFALGAMAWSLTPGLASHQQSDHKQQAQIQALKKSVRQLRAQTAVLKRRTKWLSKNGESFRGFVHSSSVWTTWDSGSCEPGDNAFFAEDELYGDLVLDCGTPTSGNPVVQQERDQGRAPLRAPRSR